MLDTKIEALLTLGKTLLYCIFDALHHHLYYCFCNLGLQKPLFLSLRLQFQLLDRHFILMTTFIFILMHPIKRHGDKEFNVECTNYPTMFPASKSMISLGKNLASSGGCWQIKSGRKKSKLATRKKSSLTTRDSQYNYCVVRYLSSPANVNVLTNELKCFLNAQ